MYGKKYLIGCLALLLIAGTIGCQTEGGSLEQKLVGKWELDTTEMKKALDEEAAADTDADNPDAAMAKMGQQMMEEMLKNMKMTMEFTADGKAIFTANMMGESNTDEGTWTAVSSSGNKLTINVKTESNDGEDGTVTFISDDTIEIDPPTDSGGGAPGMEKLRMNRVK